MDLSMLHSCLQLIVLDAPVSMKKIPESSTPKQHLESQPLHFPLSSFCCPSPASIETKIASRPDVNK